MNLKKMQEKARELSDEKFRNNELVKEYVENYNFSGKEILDIIGNKDNINWEDNPYKYVRSILIDIIIKKEEKE